MQKARLFRRENGTIYCGVCPHRCNLTEGETGICGGRQVQNGELYALNYGYCVAVAVDPIEKKPLYHFHPGREILSVGTWGCNFQCEFCQNWSLARGDADSEVERAVRLEPAEVLDLLQSKYPSAVGVAYTYNEPTVWYEYVYDTARLISENGYRNVLVTNGFISQEALKEITPYIDALNIDVKSFRDDFYRHYCKGNLNAVKQTVEYCAAHFHLEVTCLVIPTLNDSEAEIRSLVDWLATLNPDIPLHFSRYFPQYKFSLSPTPVETLVRIREMAREKMRYVYIGNLSGADEYVNTYCPGCGNLLIRRSGFKAYPVGLEGKFCTKCGYLIYMGD